MRIEKEINERKKYLENIIKTQNYLKPDRKIQSGRNNHNGKTMDRIRKQLKLFETIRKVS